jgi:DNA-binding Lrp family transcriptional regulator
VRNERRLDELDRAIIAELRVDGRISNIELGRRIGLTPAPCLRRVRRLEELGVIRSYRADIDPEAEGRGMEVMVFAEISQMTQAAIEEFESAVVQFDEILEARRMFGTPDYLLTVTVADHHAYEAFVTTKLSTVPPHHPGCLPPDHEEPQNMTEWAQQCAPPAVGAPSRIRTCDTRFRNAAGSHCQDHH